MLNDLLTIQVEAYTTFLGTTLSRTLKCLTPPHAGLLLGQWAQVMAKAHGYLTWSSGWPITQPPEDLPVTIPRFFSVQKGDQSWPLVVMSRQDLQLIAACIKQREELQKIEKIFEDALNASCEQDEGMSQHGRDICNEGRELEEALGDRTSDNGSWTQSDQAKRERMNLLDAEMDVLKTSRLHLERERAVWRYALLEHHRRVMVTQTEADQSWKDELEKSNLLEFDSKRFFETWMKLPAPYRQTRQLQRRFADYKVRFDQVNDAPLIDERSIWSSFRREDEARWEAFCAYEDGDMECEAAAKELKRCEEDLKVRERGYTTAQMNGRAVPTP